MQVTYKDLQDSEDIDKDAFAGTNTDVNASDSLYNTSDMAKLMKESLDEVVPDRIKTLHIYEEFWGIIGKTIKLTFIRPDEIEFFQYLFRNARRRYLMSVRPHHYSWDQGMLLAQLEVYFEAAVRRAVGKNFNERELIASQISQIVRSNTESLNTGDSGGRMKQFFNKVF